MEIPIIVTYSVDKPVSNKSTDTNLETHHTQFDGYLKQGYKIIALSTCIDNVYMRITAVMQK